MTLSCTDFKSHIGVFKLPLKHQGRDIELTLFASTGEGDYLHHIFHGEVKARLSHTTLVEKSETYRALVESLEEIKKEQDAANSLSFG